MTWQVASRPAELHGSSQPVSISLARALAPPLPEHWQETMLSVYVPTGSIITAQQPAQSGFLRGVPSLSCICVKGSCIFNFVNIQVQDDFMFPISLMWSVLCSQSNRQPVKLNLLTCQVKPSPEDRKCFDLISRRFNTLIPHIPPTCQVGLRVSQIKSDITMSWFSAIYENQQEFSPDNLKSCIRNDSGDFFVGECINQAKPCFVWWIDQECLCLTSLVDWSSKIRSVWGLLLYRQLKAVTGHVCVNLPYFDIPHTFDYW